MPQIRHDLMPSTVGDAEWLVFTEAKSGGFVTDVPRNKVSEFDPRTAAELKIGGMRGGDRMSPAHHNYAPQYARYLKPFINRRVVLVEIGVLKGTGLAIWCDLFPTGRIIGLDIDLEHIRSNMDHLLQAGAFRRCKPELHVFDQFEDNKERLRSMIGRDKIDIVIDDGLHWNETILRSFRDFLPLMSESFVYIVEDNPAFHCEIASKYPYLIVRDFGELTVISERTLSKTIDWRMTQLVRFATRLPRRLARRLLNTLRRLLPADKISN
jgi:hypothetical protein